MVELREKTLALFEILKMKEGENVTVHDIVNELNAQGGHPAFGSEVTVRQISGAATALSNKGLLTRVEDVVENEDGKKVTVKYLQLTEEGKMAEVGLKVDPPKKPRGRKAKDTDEVAE